MKYFRNIAHPDIIYKMDETECKSWSAVDGSDPEYEKEYWTEHICGHCVDIFLNNDIFEEISEKEVFIALI